MVLAHRFHSYAYAERSLHPHSADPPPTYPARPSAVYVGPLRTSRTSVRHVRPHVGPPCTSARRSTMYVPHVGPPCTSRTLVCRVRPARWFAVYVLFTMHPHYPTIRSPYALAHFSLGVVQYLNCAQILKC